MDRILQDFWNSNIDITGNIMEASTVFQIMRRSSLTFYKDQEASHRFYQKRDMSDMRVHIMQYEVWKKSMFIRYLLEACIFFLVAIVFQYYISRFNKDVHKLADEIEKIRYYQNQDDYKHLKEYNFVLKQFRENAHET